MERTEPMKFEARLLIGGIFEPGQIRATLEAGEVVIPQELTSNADKLWEPRAARGWKPLPLLHLQSSALSNGALDLTFLRTNGKDFIGASDWCFWKERSLNLDFEKIPNPMVTSTVVATSDDKLIIQIRGEDAHQSGNIDALGGHLDPEKDVDSKTGQVDIFGSALREIGEEVGLSMDQISSIHSLGLIYNYHDVTHYAMPFIVETPLDSNSVLNLDRDEEEKKQVKLMAIEQDRSGRDNPLNAINVIRRYYPNVDPEARMTIFLAMSFLRGKSKPVRYYSGRDEIVKIFNY